MIFKLTKLRYFPQFPDPELKFPDKLHAFFKKQKHFQIP